MPTAQLNPPRGMRDWYPEEMRFRKWLFSVWRESALRYGFEEYDSTVVEHEELYVLKSGPEILEQLFHFEDKSGRRLALRPEMTPTLARMIAARGGALAKPLKWFSIAQCFRYERMTRGRKREHYQWNLDVVGVSRVTAEAELLAVALDVLNSLGLTGSEVVVRVSHRRLLGAVLEGLEIPTGKWPGVFAMIDKRGKETEESIRRGLMDLGVSQQAVETLFSMLEVGQLEPFQEFLAEKGLDSVPLEDLRELFALLQAYGFADYLEFCPSIVRGLPYYTGTVFECFDRQGTFRAIFGGGRYDNLMGMFSSGATSAVGLGFGDVVIREILEEKQRVPSLPKQVDVFLIPYSGSERNQSVRVAQRLREKGLCVDLMLEDRRLKAALREASRSNARWGVLLLPEELEQGVLVVRDLHSGDEQRVPWDALWEHPESVLCRDP